MQIKIRYGYTDGKNWIFQTFTIEEIEKSKVPTGIDGSLKLTTRDMWTGLTDKNGVEVYIGDKIKHDLGLNEWTEREWVVGFEFGAFQLRTDGVITPSSFVFHAYTAIHNGAIYCQEEYMSHIEVIGNIHETPVK